jgi:hypothetical protein
MLNESSIGMMRGSAALLLPPAFLVSLEPNNNQTTKASDDNPEPACRMNHHQEACCECSLHENNHGRNSSNSFSVVIVPSPRNEKPTWRRARRQMIRVLQY